MTRTKTLSAASASATMALTLLLGSVVSGMLLGVAETPVADGDPLTARQALLVISMVEGVMLSALAERMTLRGPALGVVLATILFGVETGLALIEAVFFNADLRLSVATLSRTAVASLLRDALAGVAVAWIWRGTPAGQPIRLRGLPWKIVAITLMYVVAYFLAGAFIAWQSPAVRAFYANVQQISIGSLVLLQLGRGLLWTVLALLVAAYLRGALWLSALMTGASFALLMSLQLLYPNGFMPWEVRSVHIVEIAVANFVFGALAASLLLGRARPKPG